MADETTPSAPDAGSGTQPTAPAGGNAGQAQNGTPEAPLQNLPDNLKGKSVEEIARMHAEAEKKLGEQSSELGEARKLKEQTETMLRAIWANPDLYRQVEEGVKKYVSGDTPDPKPTNGEAGKGGEEAKPPVVDPAVADLRAAEENRIIEGFASKYGYATLPETERKDAYARLAVSLGELVDPGGNRPLKEVLTKIPLAKLNRFLENAHFVANKDKFAEDAKRQALVTSEENRSASIGSFAASSGTREPSVTLSEREREIARKQGISEENYLKQKQAVLKEADSFK